MKEDVDKVKGKRRRRDNKMEVVEEGRNRK
jgi:hypothetical protein